MNPQKLSKSAADIAAKPVRPRHKLVENIAPPPATGAPTPPPDAIREKPAVRARLLWPNRAHLDVAREAAAEVREPAFHEIVGPRLVDPDDLASVLELADAWSREVKAGAAWYEYAREQELYAWHTALTTLAKVRPALVAARESDAAIVAELPSLLRLVTARSEASVRAQATRRRRAGALAGAAPAAEADEIPRTKRSAHLRPRKP